MKTFSLASGSSGNCFYIEDEKQRGILVDCGISRKRIVQGLQDRGRSMENVKAVFITHEHTDHISGLRVLAKNFPVVVYSNEKTLEHLEISETQKLIMDYNDCLKVGSMEIEMFVKSHKASAPCFFSVKSNSKKVSVITDAGYACKNIKQEVSESNLLYIESNHDLKMLAEGPYPYFLKSWIKSDIGHLSNVQASLSVLEHATPKLKNIILSHLSKTNNTPDHALKTFSVLKERKDLRAKVSVSPRVIASELFCL